MAKTKAVKKNSSNNGTKRKRGRPPKKKAELPKFKNDSDIRKYIINKALELSLELVELATKKNNIKNPKVARAKTQQYKTALEGLKTVSYLLKEKDETEEKLQLMEEGISASLTAETNVEKEPSKNVLDVLKDLEVNVDNLEGLL